MASVRPRLMDAVDPIARMDALCEFIAFWLGPRQPSFGESADAVAERQLPLPLIRLYLFAGRWPHWEQQGPTEYAVPALSHQDTLVLLQRVKLEPDGKIGFLIENQGVWDCRTLPGGEDPPVWCYGDQMDENENWFTGEKLVCDSLSRFLVTFVLQELTLGARLQLCDEGLANLFESHRASAIPIWMHGPYVHGSVHDFFLWGDVLVARLWEEYFFCANHQEGIEFLTRNQGTINLISLMMGQPWNLDIREDGSARFRYLRGQIDESVEASAHTFNFSDLVETFTLTASEQGDYHTNAMVFFHRKGQSGGVRGKHVHDRALIASLVQCALQKATESNPALERLFEAEWMI